MCHHATGASTATANLTRAEAQARAALLSVERYDITLDVTGDKTFSTHSVVTFTCAQPGASTFIDFIGPSVESIDLNGEALDPATAFDGYRIQLPELAAANTLSITATGAFMNTGEGLHRFVDPVDNEVYLYTQFEVPDSRRMYPVFEQPDLKAAFAFTVTAPAHWNVISNSPTPTPVPVSDAVATWSFTDTPRISSYITALIAGPYEGVRDELTSSDGRTIPLGLFARKSLVKYLDADELLDTTKRGFEFFEREFGVAYPFEKYDQIFVPEYNAGAMENAGAVTFTEVYVFRGAVAESRRERRALTVLHELAHMWFGDLVTMRWWDDLWLNESFAEFASTECQARATRWADAWTTFLSHEKAWALEQDQLPSTHPIAADMVDFDAVVTNFDGITYAKGASVLRQLVAYVGADKFMAGLRAYFAKHAWGNTELKDLLAELSAASGRELDQWSQLWLENAGPTTQTLEVERAADGAVTAMRVTQTAPAEHPTLRPHRLVIGGYAVSESGVERVERLDLDIAGASTEVPELVGKRADVWLLNDEDWAYGKWRLDAASLETAVAHLGAFGELESQIPSALLWSILWDQTRDEEFPASAYVAAALENLGGIKHPGVRTIVVAQVGEALRGFVAPERREALTSRAADRFWQLAEAAEANSDAQFGFLKAFSQHASTPQHGAILQGLLDGSVTLPGREIDTDLRWDLVISLSSLGLADEAARAAELEADNTASGQRFFETAAAAVPDAAVKAATFERVLTEDIANETLTAIITGFKRVHDTSLLAPFVTPLLARVNEIFAERTNEIAGRLLDLFPLSLTSAALVDEVDAWLAANPDAVTALSRGLAERRDTMARWLRCQAVDAASGQ
ncbi:aminopeptidase N [Micrococcales bacterium 31B]|nr:aminopeptidase N [Micrococcales bacterium 31B]